MDAIGEQLGIDPVVLPTQGHDGTMIHAQQLEALAGWAEALADALSVGDKLNGPDYSAMTKVELQTLLDERGLTPLESNGSNGQALKEDLIHTLEADDEAKVAEEQAAPKDTDEDQDETP